MHPRQIAGLLSGERVRRGLTQEGLARSAGVGRDAVMQLEAGRRLPLGHLERIGEAVVKAPRADLDEKKPGRWLKAERLKARFTLTEVGQLTGSDPSLLATLESDRRPAFPREVAGILRAVWRGKRSLLKQLPPAVIHGARERLEEVASRLAALDHLLERYEAARLEPPDHLALLRLALVDGFALYEALHQRRTGRANRKRIALARKRGALTLAAWNLTRTRAAS